MMKYSIRGLGNDAERQNYADKIFRRVVAALKSHNSILKRNINGTHLLYGSIRIHGVDLNGMYIFHLIQE